MTKVFISPDVRTAPHGIQRVIEAMYRHLPQHGIKIVNSEAEADVVNVHAMAFVETKKPVVYSSHGFYWADHHWDNSYLHANQMMAEYMSRAKAVTAVSQWVAHAISRGMLVKPHVIYHGIDAADWQPVSDQGYVLWNKARTDIVSNPDDMNRLAELLPEVGFVSTFGRPAANVQVTGPVPHDKMRDMVAKASVYLATARETMGIGTLEALAAGVPVVGWDHGGTAEIVQHGENGYLVPFGDYPGLARAIQAALKNRKVLSKNARKTAEKWSWDAPMAQYAQIFKNAHTEIGLERPKVSVIVTAHNLGQFLPECLTSVFQQSMTDWECIVVDDASTDGTHKIVTDVVSENIPLSGSFEYIATPRNLKLSAARNFGFSHAHGRYILYLDADDYLAEDALEVLASFLDDNPEFSLAYGHLDVIDEDGGNRRRNDWPFNDFDWFQQMAHLNQMPYSTMMRREVMERSGGYRVRDWRAEDASLWCRLTSLGIRAKKATDKSTLVYRLRSTSKGSTERKKFADADGDWTSWYPWRLGAANATEGMSLIRQGKQPRTAVVPFGAQGIPQNWCWPVWSHHDPVVSVIVPVGPRHAHLLVDALDSIQAQTFPFWEAIVVNDTGKPLDTDPWPWARVVENGRHNIATSRNLGIEAARAPLVLFLDVDDLLMPNALEAMLTAYVEAEGTRYIYSDWYAIEADGSHKKQGSKDYNRSRTDGSTHPITVLMPKEWALSVGGFDEGVPGWEDWEFFIKCAVNGRCGQRLPEALLVYRMATGQRREQSLSDKDQTLPILKERYEAFYTGRKPMAGCCGGDNSTVMEAKYALGLVPRPNNGASQRSNGMARIEYLGMNEGAITIKHAAGRDLERPLRAGRHPLHRYHDVSAADAEALVATGNWRLIGAPQIDLSQAAVAQDFPVMDPGQPEETVEPAKLEDPGEMTVAAAKAYAMKLDRIGLQEFKGHEEAGKNRTSLIASLETMIEDALRMEMVPEK